MSSSAIQPGNSAPGLPSVVRNIHGPQQPQEAPQPLTLGEIERNKILEKLLDSQKQAVSHQKQILELLKMQQAGEEVKTMAKLAEGIALMSAFIGGAMLSVLINPPEVLFGPLLDEWTGGGCLDSCGTWQNVYGITSALSLTFLSISLLLCIPVGLGEFNNFFSMAVMLFVSGLIMMALSVIAASWLAYSLTVAILTTIFMSVFIFSSFFILFPCGVLAWYFIYGPRCELKVIDPKTGQADIIKLKDANIIHFVAHTKWLHGIRGPVTKVLLVVRPKLVHSKIKSENNNGLYGDTPLDLAAKLGHITMMKVLLDNGAKINGASREFTPLHQAILCHQEEAVKLLIKEGADINAKGFEGRRPLHFAVTEGSENIVKLLLEKDVLVNAPALNGKTALHLAVELRSYNIAELLLNDERGRASMNEQDIEGKTALRLAMEMGCERMVSLLQEEFGADFGEEVYYGEEVHYAQDQYYGQKVFNNAEGDMV